MEVNTMKTKAIFILLTIVSSLIIANMVLASQQIIWDPATVEVVLMPGTDLWENDRVEAPHVMYDNGVYKMWYRGSGTKPNPTVEFYEDAIGYATSADGVNWSNRQLVYGPVPGYPQTKSPSVIKEGATYRMWLVDYYEWVGGEWSGYVTHMDGTDGVSWHNQQKVMSAQGQLNPQGDGYNIESVCVLDEGSQYTMWYEVADLAAPYREKIWRATSTDGINWDNRQLSLPYGQETWEYRVKRPDVVSDGQGGYTMYYTVASEVGFWQLAMATSEDGITWNNRQLIGIPGANPSYFEDVDGTPYLYFDEVGPIFRVMGSKVPRPISVDIKPGTCPNSCNLKAKGPLPVAILGTVDLDINDIDLATVRLEGVAPIRSGKKDVATPFDGELCDCHELEGDGFVDLTLKFDPEEIMAALGPVSDGDEIVLTLTGQLVGGTPIEGQDCVVILDKGKK
jgi:hypothetical protein